MNEIVSIEDFRQNDLKSKVRGRVNQVKHDLKIFFQKNKDLVIAAVPFIASGTVYLVKTGIKHHQNKKTQDLKELYCYDRSLGHYWKLRRELTNDEWVIIDRRKKNGERLADILEELKVLK